MKSNKYDSYFGISSTDKTKSLNMNMADAVIEGLNCGICLQIANEAVETSCCHHIFCEHCLEPCLTCPICRVNNLEYKISTVIRRLISNLPMTCEYCSKQFTRDSLNIHLGKCEKRLMKCPNEACSFSGVEDEFIQHLVSAHRKDVIANAGTLFKKDTVSTTTVTNSLDTFLDPIATTCNTSGRTARLGSSGKYYCQGRLENRCLCCDGQCGPGNGCNCRACMQLDVKSRRLPRGYLVNREGATARRGEENRFYCGRRVLVGVHNCDGYCGPADGPNCRACQILETQASNRYSALV